MTSFDVSLSVSLRLALVCAWEEHAVQAHRGQSILPGAVSYLTRLREKLEYLLWWNIERFPSANYHFIHKLQLAKPTHPPVDLEDDDDVRGLIVKPEWIDGCPLSHSSCAECQTFLSSVFSIPHRREFDLSAIGTEQTSASTRPPAFEVEDLEDTMTASAFAFERNGPTDKNNGSQEFRGSPIFLEDDYRPRSGDKTSAVSAAGFSSSPEEGADAVIVRNTPVHLLKEAAAANPACVRTNSGLLRSIHSGATDEVVLDSPRLQHKESLPRAPWSDTTPIAPKATVPATAPNPTVTSSVRPTRASRPSTKGKSKPRAAEAKRKGSSPPPAEKQISVEQIEIVDSSDSSSTGSQPTSSLSSSSPHPVLHTVPSASDLQSLTRSLQERASRFVASSSTPLAGLSAFTSVAKDDAASPPPNADRAGESSAKAVAPVVKSRKRTYAAPKAAKSKKTQRKRGAASPRASTPKMSPANAKPRVESPPEDEAHSAGSSGDDSIQSVSTRSSGSAGRAEVGRLSPITDLPLAANTSPGKAKNRNMASSLLSVPSKLKQRTLFNTTCSESIGSDGSQSQSKTQSRTVSNLPPGKESAGRMQTSIRAFFKPVGGVDEAGVNVGEQGTSHSPSFCA